MSSLREGELQGLLVHIDCEADKFKSSDNDSPTGPEEGEHSGLDGKHEPMREPQHGTDSGVNVQVLEGDNLPLRVADILERFQQETRTRLRDSTTQRYRYIFRKFAKSTNLESYTRRQLGGPKGRVLILSYLERVPKLSWRWTVAALKPVWVYGLKLPWPIDSKRDLPKLPRARRRQSPPDAQVKVWADALKHERDPYLRVLWLLVAQHGWRPSHVCNLKWRNVQYNDCGRPVAIVADGLQESFKTCSPIAARLSPDVADALQQWSEKLGPTSPDWPILPWRSAKGWCDSSRTQTRPTFILHWQRIEKKWQLPHLTPCHLRHWVATTSRRAGLSKQATAYLMGHDATQGGAMRDWYDSPQLQDILDEQAERLPRGPLGMLEPLSVEIEGGLPREVIGLVSTYLAGQMGTMEFANQMERLRLQRSTNPILEA